MRPRELHSFMMESIQELEPGIDRNIAKTIIETIVKANFPICAKKYLSGENWKLEEQ